MKKMFLLVLLFIGILALGSCENAMDKCMERKTKKGIPYKQAKMECLDAWEGSRAR